MAVVVAERTKLLGAVQAVAATIAEMIRPPADMDRPIPRSEWTVGEPPSHQVSARRRPLG